MREIVFAAVLVAIWLGSAGAQPAPVSTGHAVRLIKLPNGDYTVPMSALAGSATSGRVTLHPQGLKTLVTVVVAGSGRHVHAFNLHSGKDCAAFGGPSSIALAPAMTGQPSKTLLTLPITNLTSKDYVVAVRDANAKQEFKEACARL